MGTRRSFGNIRKLASGRFQARYTMPDSGMVIKAPSTFAKRAHADRWLGDERRRLDTALWNPAGANKPEAVLFGDYAPQWIAQRRTRRGPLAPTTREQYERVLARNLMPVWGDRELASITPDEVRVWFSGLLPDAPTMRAQCYRIFRAIMTSAWADELTPINPCRVRGAGQVDRVHEVIPASLPELAAITEGMPDYLRCSVTVAGYCGLRSGELRELRRKDIDVNAGVIKVRRAVTQLKTGFHVGPPKSRAGIRDVHVPPHLMDEVEEHLSKYVAAEQDSLLFPREVDTPLDHLPHWKFNRVWHAARAAGGRGEMTFHDLRHTAGTMTARTGATTAELMSRLGQSTPATALQYQHAARGRDEEIASLMSKLAENG